MATAVASALYLFGLSPSSAAQDFYAYAGTVAIQPAGWLATSLVLGGIRNLHIHQYAELAERSTDFRRRANDLSDGLQRATAEIDALERRIAMDMSSVAAFSRSLSQIDMRDRCAAAMSLGELFRVGAGARTFTFYLKDREVYAPVWALEDDNPRPPKSIESIPATAIERMMSESAILRTADDDHDVTFGARQYVIGVPPCNGASNALAAIVCELETVQETRHFPRRAEELARMFATILQACPNPPSEQLP